jgi:hypothetical protein
MLPLIAQRDLQRHAAVLLAQNLALQQLAQALLVDQLESELACCDYLKLVAPLVVPVQRELQLELQEQEFELLEPQELPAQQLLVPQL